GIGVMDNRPGYSTARSTSWNGSSYFARGVDQLQPPPLRGGPHPWAAAPRGWGPGGWGPGISAETSDTEKGREKRST
ncbi:Hypothetical predicted protein, partial [Pelobates cultripes]